MVFRGGSLTYREPCLTADGKHVLIIAGNDVRLYSAVSGDQLSTLTGHDAAVTAVVLDPKSSSQVYTSSRDGTIKLWSLESGEVLRTFTIDAPIEGFVISALYNKAYVSVPHKEGRAGRIFSYDLDKGVPGQYRIKTSSARRLYISPRGTYAAFVERHSLLLWSTSPQHEGTVANFTHTKPYVCVAFDGRDQVLSAGDQSGRIMLWHHFADTLAQQQARKEQQQILPPPRTTWHWHAHAVRSLSFSADSSHLLSGGQEAVVVVWTVETGHRTYLPRLGGALVSIKPSPQDPFRYLVAQADNTVRVINTSTMKVECSIYGIQPPAASDGYDACGDVALQPGGSALVLPCSNAVLQFYDVARDVHVAKLQVAPRNPVSLTEEEWAYGVYGPPSSPQVDLMAFSPDGSVLATVDVQPDAGRCGSTETTLRFWDRSSSSSSSAAAAAPYELNTLVSEPHGSGRVSSLCYHPQQHMLVTTSLDCEFKVWVRQSSARRPGSKVAQPTCWRCRSVGSYKGLPLHCSTFSSDGSILAVAAAGTATLWDPASNRLVATLQPPAAAAQSEIAALQFVAGSPYLVGLLHPLPGSSSSSSSSSTLVVWNLLTAAVAWSLQLPVVALAADPQHALFAVVLQLPSAIAAAAGQQQHLAVHSHVLVFDPASPVPKLSCPVPSAAVSRCVFVPPASRLYSSAAGGTGGTISPLVLVTADRRYALVHVPGSGAAAAAQQEQQQEEEQQQQVSAFEAAFGQVSSSVPAAEEKAAAATPAALLQQQVAALFDSPSHVLPPPAQLCTAFLELLVTGQRSGSA